MNLQEMNDNLNLWLNELWNTIKNLPNDEKISWGSIIVGTILVITAFFLWL